MLPNISPRPPKEKLLEFAALLPVGSSSLLFVSLPSAALLAAKAENDPLSKLDVNEPTGDPVFCDAALVAPNSSEGASAFLLSSLPLLPNTEPEDGLVAEPNALPGLDAKPPNAELLGVVLASFVGAGDPKALNADPAPG